MSEKIINIFSPDWDPYNGYGRKSLELVYHLSALGYTVNALGADALAHADKLTPEMIALLKKPVKLAVGGIVLGYPDQIPDYGNILTAGPMIAQTMFESTQLPEGWARWLNQCAAVCVPARWLIKVMESSGVIRPVVVIAEGVSESFHYMDRAGRYEPSGLKYGRAETPEGDYIPRKDQPFTFLCLGDRGMRKGFDVALAAFVRAFGENENYKIIIKAREFKFGYTNTNIDVIARDMDDGELNNLYASVDAFVFPTRGEGFGLPPREAARTGLPVIATNWGGTADDLTRWGYPLRYEKVKAWDLQRQFEGLGKWAEPDVDHLAQLMKYIVSRQRIHTWYEVRPQGERQDTRAANNIRKLYSWQKFALGIAKVWEKVSAKQSITARREVRKARRG